MAIHPSCFTKSLVVVLTFATSVFITASIALAEAPDNPSAGSANGHLPELPRKQLWESGRPANFYGLEYARPRNEDVCHTVLDALNEPREWPKEFAPGKGFLSWLLVLTDNKLSIEWTEFDAPGVPLSRAIVDIDNDGELDAVYRKTSSLSSVRHQYLLATTDLPDDQEDDYFRNPDRPGTGEYLRERFDRIRGREIVFGSYRFYPGWVVLSANAVDYGTYPAPETSGFMALGQYYNVLSVDGETLILAGGSHEPYINTHPVPMRLYRPRSYHSHKFLCEFRAQYKF